MAKTKPSTPLTAIVPIGRIKPNPKNPRVLRDEKLEKLKRSLLDFPDMLNYRPLVVVSGDDDTFVVLGGNQRLKALQAIGVKEVPILVADHWTPEQQQEFVIKDNVSFGDWDWTALARDFTVQALDGFGLDIPADFGIEKTKGLKDADETYEPPKAAVSREGDIWVMGNHRLICGDSTKASVVEAVLAGAKPHLMVTDPPYGVDYDPKWRVRAGVNLDTAASGLVRNDTRADWREAWALFGGDVAYVWHDGANAHTAADSLLACGFGIRSQIIWNNGRLVIGRGDYHWQHEPCWYLVREGKKGHYVGDRKQTTVWDIPKPKKLETGHSTQKPVECMRRPILNNSEPGDFVYEPFSGSGTTIIACEETGRQCRAIELAPEYVDVAVIRWQEFTGKQAVLEATGQTLEEVKAERTATVAA